MVLLHHNIIEVLGLLTENLYLPLYSIIVIGLTILQSLGLCTSPNFCPKVYELLHYRRYGFITNYYTIKQNCSHTTQMNALHRPNTVLCKLVHVLAAVVSMHANQLDMPPFKGLINCGFGVGLLKRLLNSQYLQVHLPFDVVNRMLINHKCAYSFRENTEFT